MNVSNDWMKIHKFLHPTKDLSRAKVYFNKLDLKKVMEEVSKALYALDLGLYILAPNSKIQLTTTVYHMWALSCISDSLSSTLMIWQKSWICIQNLVTSLGVNVTLAKSNQGRFISSKLETAENFPFRDILLSLYTYQ